MAGYENRTWKSADGLQLHVRDYPGGEGRPPILCIPGLTRNARDFEEVADRLAGAWRVLAVDLRGRGDSAYAPFSRPDLFARRIEIRPQPRVELRRYRWKRDDESVN